MSSYQRREAQHWLDSMRGVDDPGGGDGPGRTPGWLPKGRAGASAAIVALLVMAGFWIWAFSPLAPSGHPDVLNNVVFTHDAEDICSDAVRAANRLPGAAEATGPEDRATQIVATTLLFEEMVTDLRAEADDVAGSDGELVDAWLGDWDTYLDDRRAYAETLAGGSDPPFTVTARDGEAVTGYIDIFAEINNMPSCRTPGDV
ncbi:MAG: hypothetical protein J4F99_02770 [Acidimicrobiia bacterium]|nr:hypothetical protein [Acidimicrobiia bacterium]